MSTHRFVLALLSGPAAAAAAFYLLWLAWLVLFVSSKPGEVLADWSGVIGLLSTWPIVAVAFLCAFVVEIVVGLPLFAVFRRLGWLSLSAFLVGGCAAAVAFYFATRGGQLPGQGDLAVTAVLLLVPGCTGALVFGYTGGWLTGRLSGPA